MSLTTRELIQETVEKPHDAARRTLAMRIAHRNRLRAERLARQYREPKVAGLVDPAGEQAAPSSVSPAAALATAPEPTLASPLVAQAAGRSTFHPGDGDSSAALEEFLRALNGGRVDPAVVAEPKPGAVLRFQHPAAANLPAPVVEPPYIPVCDLDRLTGAGPGLIWALQRVGIACLADMAAVEPGELIDRLGLLGRMIPAETWISTARAAVRKF